MLSLVTIAHFHIVSGSWKPLMNSAYRCILPYLRNFFLLPTRLTKTPEMLCPPGRLREGWTQAFSGQRVHKSKWNDLELPEVPVSVFL